MTFNVSFMPTTPFTLNTNHFYKSNFTLHMLIILIFKLIEQLLNQIKRKTSNSGSFQDRSVLLLCGPLNKIKITMVGVQGICNDKRKFCDKNSLFSSSAFKITILPLHKDFFI